ncbi:MAG: hypothetical protein FJX36_04770 [Alphaproteobacteria bacterium]|nr:hypothetical protein [Alphaproteobacteria bacterium]
MSGELDLWWIDRPWLAGGACPDDAGLVALRAAEFDWIVCLLDAGEQAPRYSLARAERLGLAWSEIPIPDRTAPTVEQMKRFVAIIVDRLREGDRLFVHCAAGLGRTGTMAAVALVAHGMTAADAIARVRAARPGAIETPEQEAAVRTYAGARGV